MKRILIILIALMSLFAQLSFGQLKNIFDLSCPLDNLTVNDTVTINYHYGFPSQPCIKDSIKITSKNDTCIQINVYYNVGDAASPCSGYDSINLGKLASNIYSIIFNLYSTGNIYSDSDTITIEVNEISTLNHISKMNDFRIYPNPAQNQIIISGLPSGLNFFIYDIHGQEMKSMEINNTEHTMDITNLDNGIYLIKVCDNKKIVIQNKILIKK